MTRPLAATVVVVCALALWLAFTLAGRVDDTVQLEAAATSTDRLPDGFGGYVAGLHDRTPPTAPPSTTTTAAKPKQSTPPWDGWTWDELKDCETPGLGWDANTGNGYSGGLQMDAVFWETYGGLEFAAEPWMATREEQIVVAERGLAVQGPSAWPTCSYRVGMR